MPVKKKDKEKKEEESNAYQTYIYAYLFTHQLVPTLSYRWKIAMDRCQKQMTKTRPPSLLLIRGCFESLERCKAAAFQFFNQKLFNESKSKRATSHEVMSKQKKTSGYPEVENTHEVF